MVDLVNPYANPYLPSFVNQRPRINDVPKPQQIPQVYGSTYSQIHSVSGFEGARNYANGFANGSSEIISESDPETARIYIVAKDQNGEVFLQAFRLTPEEEPKQITMDDLNTKMTEILERMNKLEEGKLNGQSGNELPGEPEQLQTKSSGRNSSIFSKSASNNTTNAAK